MQHSTFSLKLSLSTIAVLMFVGLTFTSCGGGGSGGTPAPNCTSGTSQNRNVTINWAANNESQVNTTGGGYKVYISQTSGFNVGDAGVTVVNVPYVSGASAPTSTVVNLSSGTYYVRVAAFTAFPVDDTTGTASSQISVCVPFL